MRKTLTLLALFLAYCPGYSQFKTIEKKGKYGLMNGDELILKTRYDSLVIKDEHIITAFRKKRIYYFNSDGEKMYAGPHLNASPFEHGSGIASKRNGKFLIVGRDGEPILEPTECNSPPTRYGPFIEVVKKEEDYFDRPVSNTTLYSDSGLVSENIDSLYTFEDFLVAEETKSYRKVASTLFDIRTGDKVEDNLLSIKDTLGHLFLKRNNFSTTLYNKLDFSKSTDHGEISFIDSVYFSSSRFGISSLYKWKKHQLLIKTECDSFVFHSETIYALGPHINQKQSLEIYDYNGNALQKGLDLVYDLGDERWIFGKDSLEYIGNEKGEALSSSFSQISPLVVNGYRIVFDEFRYSYINDSTYEKLPVDLAIIFREKKYSNSNVAGGLIQALITIIMIPVAAVLAPLTKGKSLNMLRGFSPEVGSTYIIKNPAERQYFSEGMAVFSWYGMDNDSTMTVANNNDSLFYNYIDMTGTILNEKKFKDCFPFRGGKAWVSESKKDYILIDKTGKKVGNHEFEFVNKDENGFHKCSNEYTSSFFIFSNTYRHYVLFSDKNERLHKGHFSSIYFEDGAYYGIKGEKTKLIYELPEVEDEE